MNTTSTSLYAVLGVPKDADKAAICTAFRARMRQTHPDGRPPEDAAAAHEEMVLLNLAYETLRDPGKRAAYDFDRRTAGNAKREQHREPPPPPTPPRPPTAPPKPRVIILNRQHLNLGLLWPGTDTREQVVVEARFDDGSPIRTARVINTTGSFWHVVSEPLVRDTTRLIIRIQRGPVAPGQARRQTTERVHIRLDDVTATIGVTAFIRPPPAPRLTLANWRLFRLTCLGLFMLLSALLLLGSLLFAGAYMLLNAAPGSSHGPHPLSTYAAYLDTY
ncbi:J domain-containing protein [Streptomyces canus]|uniref:J domain-containing protein n=1 Tax=Streptomyces canus TaxID=58343 RepID=UPI00225AEB86|nr:J domain-containing protein [Streptomyces canus]MCX4856594.1 J domain-containing protein [Streptomyces canus]